MHQLLEVRRRFGDGVGCSLLAQGVGIRSIVELEDSGGAKMRLHLKGGAVPDVTALVRSFWGIEA